MNSTINRIENDLDNPNFETLKKLAIALEVNKELLLIKCGYSDMPEEFIYIYDRSSSFAEKKMKKMFKMFNDIIDKLILEK